jgi:hypothetical protein
MSKPARARRSTATSAAPGDWMDAAPATKTRPAAALVDLPAPTDYDEVYAAMEGGKSTAMSRFMEALRDGKAEVVDAVLYCARFDKTGRAFREGGKIDYQLLPVKGHEKYREAMAEAERQFRNLDGRTRRAAARAAERAMSKGRGAQKRAEFREGWPFLSSSDLGSTYQQDPNQFTEYTPYFNGPFAKQQYFDYFAGHARAYQEYTHSPIGKRIVDILVQYAFGRGFKVRCRDDAKDQKWREFNRSTASPTRCASTGCAST